MHDDGLANGRAHAAANGLAHAAADGLAYAAADGGANARAADARADCRVRWIMRYILQRKWQLVLQSAIDVCRVCSMAGTGGRARGRYWCKWIFSRVYMRNLCWGCVGLLLVYVYW